MSSTREQIYAAFFAQALPVAQTFFGQASARRIQSLAEMGAVQQPTLFQLEVGEDIRPKKGLPALRFLDVLYIIYLTGYSDSMSQNTILPSTQVNNALDALQANLAPDPGTGLQTLGGVVSHAWVEGRTEIIEATNSAVLMGKLRARALAPVGYN